MRTTIDKAGRLVIPAAVRERLGLVPGTTLEVSVEETGLRLERVAAGPQLGGAHCGCRHGLALLPRGVLRGDAAAPEFRVGPAAAARLLHEEVFSRMAVHHLPAVDRESFMGALVQESIAGGRIYDAPIAEVAPSAGAA